MSFPVVLSSSYCKDEYPTNQGCEFSNVLNRPLPNTENWSVAISDLVYEPDFWPTVRKPFNKFGVHIGQFPCHLKKYVHFRLLHVKIVGHDEFPADPNQSFKVRMQFTSIDNNPDTNMVVVLDVKIQSSIDIYGRRIYWNDYKKADGISYLSHFGRIHITEADHNALLPTYPTRYIANLKQRDDYGNVQWQYFKHEPKFDRRKRALDEQTVTESWLDKRRRLQHEKIERKRLEEEEKEQARINQMKKDNLEDAIKEYQVIPPRDPFATEASKKIVEKAEEDRKLRLKLALEALELLKATFLDTEKARISKMNLVQLSEFIENMTKRIEHDTEDPSGIPEKERYDTFVHNYAVLYHAKGLMEEMKRLLPKPTPTP